MSNVVALHPPLNPRKDASAAELYLARLRPGSRATQLKALGIIARILGGTCHPHWFPWHAVTPGQAGHVRDQVAQRYAPATARRILSAFRGAVHAAWQLGQLDADTRDRICDIAPVKGSRLPAGRALGPEEAAALYKAADKEDALALALMLGGGLRREEAVGLQACAIAISHPLRQGPEHMGQGPDQSPYRGMVQSVPQSPSQTLVRITVLGKGSKERALYVAGYAGALLAAEAGRPGPVLRVRSGSGLWRRLRRLAQRAGVPALTPHDLRRSYASQALAKADLATVQTSMGHADPRTTARYDRRGEDALRAAALALASTSDPVLP